MKFFNQNARDVYNGMFDHAALIGQLYGQDGKEHAKANASLLNVVRFLNEAEGQQCVIHADGELGISFNFPNFMCVAIWFESRDERYKDMETKPGEWSMHS